MTWNYRVIEWAHHDGSPYRSIHEVYYADGKPSSYIEAASTVVSDDDGGNKADLSWVLDRMREALDKPVLHEKDFI